MTRLLVILLALGTAACASSGTIPKPFPGATGSSGAPAATGASEADAPPATGVAIPDSGRFQPEALIQTAMGFRGVPYRNGGSDPSGFDCSGFVQYVLARQGVPMPRTVAQQFKVGRKANDIEPGDLVFFQTIGSKASHVGIAVDEYSFVHAPNSRGVVRIDRLDAPYWAGRFLGARRVY